MYALSATVAGPGTVERQGDMQGAGLSVSGE